MKIGCTFPNKEIGNDPDAIRDFAQAAEELGYTHIMTYDHVLGAVHENRNPPLVAPYDENTPFHEIFVTLGFLAGVTKEIEFLTGILILPQRQTVLVAKQAAEVDILSGGRLRLGVGSGWNYVEYQGLNENWETRGSRYGEQIELLRRLWSEPVIDFDGKYHRIDRAGICPRPDRNIPIWIGGFHDRVLRRAAKVADGFIFSAGGRGSLDAAQKLRGYLAEQGRDPSTFGIEAVLSYSAGPEKWETQFNSWLDIGASHVCLNTLDTGLVGADAQIKALRHYAGTMGLKKEK